MFRLQRARVVLGEPLEGMSEVILPPAAVERQPGVQATEESRAHFRDRHLSKFHGTLPSKFVRLWGDWANCTANFPRNKSTTLPSNPWRTTSLLSLVQ